MKRPIQHQIDTKAKRIFVNSLPTLWVEREQGSDYGVDYELEIFKQEQSTGQIAKIQLKGTTNIKIKNGIIKFKLELPNVNYLLNEIKIPTFLFIVDVNTKNIYWKNIKCSKTIRSDFNAALKKQRKSILIKIPETNTFDDKRELFPGEIDLANSKIAFDGFNNIDNKTFINFIEDSDSLEKCIIDSEIKLNLLYGSKLFKILESGEYDKVIEEADKIISTIKGTNESIFNILYLRDFALEAILHSVELDEKQKYLISIENAQLFIKYLPRNNLSFKCYSLINYHTKHLEYLCWIEFGIYSNTLLYTEKEEYLKLMANTRRNDIIIYIHRLYNHILKLLKFQLKTESSNLLLAENIYRVVESLRRLVFRIVNEIGNEINNDNFLGHILTILDIGINISILNKDDKNTLRGKLLKIDLLRVIDKKRSITYINNLMVSLKKNPDKSLFNMLKNIKDELLREQNDYKLTIDDEINHYKQMASGLGINLDDKEDDISKIINIGIKDLNPHRILKNCIHLFVQIDSFGIPAQMMKLPTAGSKILHCTKHHYAIGSMELDFIYKSFEKEYCSKCKNRKPQKKGWEWNREWQIEQDKKYEELIKSTKSAF